jgi:methyl-accepting chemotaxis protein
MELNEHSVQQFDKLEQAESALLEQQLAMRGFVASHDPQFLNVYKSKGEALDAALNDFRANTYTPAQAEQAVEVERLIAIFRNEAETLMAEAGNSGSAAQVNAKVATTARLTAIRKVLAALEANQREKLTLRIAAVRSDFFTTIIILFGTSILTVGLAIGAGLVLAQQIANPVVAMTVAMKRLARGDLSVIVPAAGRKDEIGDMADAVEVFKQAALDKQRLETAAASEREAAQIARERAEAEVLAKERSSVVVTIGEAMTALSQGDLTYRIPDALPREYNQLRQDFNEAAETLHSTIKTINQSSGGILAGSEEIAGASSDLSQRTEQQAANLEETAAALDEITATVKTTAEGAKKARAAVAQAKQSADKSGQIVEDAVAAMEMIKSSSGQIGQIIGVIDEIAFQTNLLALNAGVEAARAGDAGRGFAVVASEVRALAQRSAEAAKQIKTLIGASGDQVAQGVNLVARTGEALHEIVAEVGQIDALVGDIAASAQEQATGLAAVNTAVNQMDQMTQQNAAMVEQSTAASQSLATEANSLGRLVSKFRLAGSGQAEPQPSWAGLYRAGRAA